MFCGRIVLRSMYLHSHSSGEILPLLFVLRLRLLSLKVLQKYFLAIRIRWARVLSSTDHQFEVTGIIRDIEKSHLEIGALLSMTIDTTTFS